MKVIEDACFTYACACTVKTAIKPPQPIEKSTAAHRLLAQVIVSKLADHLPLHRQAKMFRRHGIEIAEQTMCGWMAQCAELLDPLYERLKRHRAGFQSGGHRRYAGEGAGSETAASAQRAHLAVRGRSRSSGGGLRLHSRRGSAPGRKSFLKPIGDTCRRTPMWPTIASLPEAGTRDGGSGLLGPCTPACVIKRWRTTRRACGPCCCMIARVVWGGESWRASAGLRGEELRLLREQGARPVLEQAARVLARDPGATLPKSEAGQAVNYILKNWTALTRYCENPDLSIDNNHTERSLRGWAVGRNNWTFFGSDRGGKTAAVLRSFVASCELVKVDPFAWFHDVLSRIAGCPMSRLDELLPHRWVRDYPASFSLDPTLTKS